MDNFSFQLEDKLDLVLLHKILSYTKVKSQKIMNSEENSKWKISNQTANQKLKRIKRMDNNCVKCA